MLISVRYSSCNYIIVVCFTEKLNYVCTVILWRRQEYTGIVVVLNSLTSNTAV